MSEMLFGTDGIRARAGDFPLNVPAIQAIGQAVGERLGGRLLVGQDTRMSSPWILGLLKQGIRQTSATIEDAGVIPTPAIALLIKTGGFSGGIMISASHNPFDDNGIKVFRSDGTKLDDQAEKEVERRIQEILQADSRTRKDEIPDVPISAENATVWPQHYEELLQSHFPEGQWLRGLKIVVDCANGAMSRVAPSLLKQLGADLHVIHASPDGRNINAGCGAVHLEALTDAMKHVSADFGVAYDGDGDRSLFVSGEGRRIDGDPVLLVMARRLQRAGLANPSVVGTSMTNFALEQVLRAEGMGLTRVSVGDRFIFEEMQRGGSVIGGEPSGHIIFSDFRLSGDGLLTTLKVAEAIVESHSSLDDLTRDWVEAPQLLEGVRVLQRVPLETLPAVQAKIAEVGKVLQHCGRIVVRYSGTEPLLRVMIESDDASRNRFLMDELLAVIRDSIREYLQ